MSVEIKGLEDFDRLAGKLRDLEAELQPTLIRAAADAADGLEDDARKSARELLPTRGGLSNLVANSIYVEKTGSWRFSIRATNERNIARMDRRGIVRHPVYGRDEWVDQRIRKGWWSVPVAEARRRVEDAMQATMDKLAKRVSD